MKQRRKRYLAMISAFAVLFSNSGLTVFAEGAAGEDGSRQAPVCGFEEHVHSDDCYEQVLICGTEESEPQTERVFHSDFQVHYHTNDCKDEAGNLICGLVEGMYYHTHNQYCKDEKGHFVCGLEKKEPHEHTDECYREDRTLVCNKAETEGHQHDASCYETKTELVCERPEDPGHHHTEACYTQSKELFCGEEEDPGHHHTEACYEQRSELTCGEAEDPGHHHTESCYIHHRELTCGEAEDAGHHHTEACYIQRKELNCGENEDPGHHHTEACYVQKKELTCGTEEDPGHHHTEACYIQKKELTCGTEEDPGHHHTAECYRDWEEYTCGLEESEEHTHTQECVTTHHDLVCEETERDGHTHTDACYTVRDELVCEETERDGHTHTDACYTIRDELACEETERDGHIHTDACYTVYDDLVCGEAERDGHTHTDACYTVYEDLACGEAERDGHTHTDACYTDYDELACEETERDGHTHTDACYTVYDELVCGETERDGHLHTDACYTIHDNLTCTEEEREGHTHTEACYRTWDELVCGKEEAEAHTHSDACYKTDRILICEIPTTTHHHTKKCYNEEGLLTCGELEIPTFECTEENWTEETISEGHHHTEVCYENQLTCTKTEHTHTKECYPAAAADVPTDDPTDVPTDDPTDVPTDDPTDVPADDPTDVPTDDPTDVPTDDPTDVPADDPTDVPADDPTDVPTDDPTDVPTDDPTDVPADDLTDVPADVPTDDPTDVPTDVPTDDPTDVPTDDPTDVLGDDPTDVPTDDPTDTPTDVPTDVPTDNPTDIPSDDPTDVPADDPTDVPTNDQTDVPTDDPTDVPTDAPADDPTDVPTDIPADDPTDVLTDNPTDVPTDDPTDIPTNDPTDVPMDDPTDVPVDDPTDLPTDDPIDVPTDVPMDDPTDVPTDNPTDVPEDDPTDVPTDNPTDVPADDPTDVPTDDPADESGKAIEDKTEEPAEKPQEGVSEESVQKPAEGSTKNPTKNQTNDSAPKPASKPVSKPAEQITEKIPEEPAEDLPEKTDEDSNSKAEEEPDEKQPVPAEQEELQLATPTDLIGESETDKPEDLTLATPTDLVGEPDTADPETEDPAATEPDAEESSISADPEEENTPAVQTGWEGTIESGDTEFHVAISFGADACIPEGASLVISEAEGNADRGGTVEQPKLTKGALKSSSRMSMAKGAAADEEPHRNIFSLTTWRMNENEPEIILYQKKLDISLVANGEEIEPDPDARITVSLQLPGIEEGQKVEVRHITDEGNELLESSNNGGEIVFVTNGFSLFEFTSKAQALSSWTTETTENTFYGKTQEQKAEAAILTDTGAAEGLEVLEAYNVTGGNDLWLTIRPAQKQELGEMESLVLYSVTDGTANEIVKENISAEEYIRFSTEELSSFALVKDTGYRHKSIELTVEGEPSGEGEEVGLASILLDGMMPKKAEATAVDVTADFADYEYPVSEEQEKETKGDNSEAEQTEEETEDEEKETGATARRTTLAAFNITIANNDSEYQPDAEHPINVEIVDPRITMADGKSIELWHIKDDGTRERVSIFTIEEGKISFEADGFSAYAIVMGPAAGSQNEKDVENVAELAQNWNDRETGGKGFYLSYDSKKHYVSNEIILTGTNNENQVLREVDSNDITNDCIWFFEKQDGTNSTESNLYYIYTYRNNEKKYIHRLSNTNNNVELSDTNKTVFDLSNPASKLFYLKHQGQSSWLQHSGSGLGIRFYKDTNSQINSRFTFTYAATKTSNAEPYGLDGKTYGLMYWNGGVAGKALMANKMADGSLEAKALEVMTKSDNARDKLFVPNDSDISMWTFRWVDNDHYCITSRFDGTDKYLSIAADGISFVGTEADATPIRVIPGTGNYSGMICLKANDVTLTYSGSVDGGFNTSATGGTAGSEWLHLVEYSDLTSDYMITYSASKVGVSDPAITNGSKIIIYTRFWNDNMKRYDYYAIDHDGSLVRCFESGDSIQWIGNRINTLLWNLVEYYDDNGERTNYYELYNEYSEKYIAPQISSNQVLSPNIIGINLDGRKRGQYYTNITAWDDPEYTFASLMVENEELALCRLDNAYDFYFAVMQDLNYDDDMAIVKTVDHVSHGITMKIKDLPSREYMDSALGNSHSWTGDPNKDLQQGILSTDLKDDGYPTTKAGGSLASLFSGADKVNHLFIESTYNATGYYSYDSSQNYATYIGSKKEFRVYKEIGTHDTSPKTTLQHGQFFPFNDIKPGVFASVNRENLYPAIGSNQLPDSDPRKHERLYLIEKPNYHFGVELEASFVQTPSGKDNWGHDIIYEFTGDDDFWLYVDGELVVDLGGIHSAMSGSVNYSTGDVYVCGRHTTLKELFYQNYKGRGHTEEEAQQYVDELFVENGGKWIFKDYTTHKMRIFYFERGAGASNLNMRFNLSSVQEGHVELSKRIDGIENADSMLTEYPFQIWYREALTSPEKQLGRDEQIGGTEGGEAEGEDFLIRVLYKDTTTPVPFKEEYKLGGVTYHNVFILKPGETADINFPDDGIYYKVVECGVNSDVYSNVAVQGMDVERTEIEAGQEYQDNRRDYQIEYAKTRLRPRVTYANTVDPKALHTLTIKKKLYDETGETEITDNSATFSFRLSFSPEGETGFSLADKFAYHIKNENGEYCKWNAQAGTFVSTGKTDYSEFITKEQKAEITFLTSIYGAVSKIPASYTVEIREVLVGTRFEVDERSYEIPDGYSLQRYELFTVSPNASEAPTEIDLNEPKAPVKGIIVDEGDSLVHIRNLKGYGVRIYKTWTDKDYMAERDPVYFAVYTKNNATGLLTLASDIKCMSQDEDTLYWYFETLNSIPFKQYEVHEIQLLDGTPAVDSNGKVTNTAVLTITPVPEGGTLNIEGRQKGEGSASLKNYTVHYDQRTPEEGSNVRVDYVTNTRPGVILKKTNWDGSEKLNETEFSLQDAAYRENDATTASLLHKSYISDADGYVTTAFLNKETEYILTETKAKPGYHGLEEPVTFRTNRVGWIDAGTITGMDNTQYTLTVDEDGNQVLTIKNKIYTFAVRKQDSVTEGYLAGAHFSLHRERTVGGVTIVDFTPMPGYEDLISNAEGIIPGLNQTLPAGIYELREKQAPPGYAKLPSGIKFELSELGAIVLLQSPEGTHLEREDIDEGGEKRVIYTLKIANSADTKWPWLKITKQVEGGMYDSSQEYTFTIAITDIPDNQEHTCTKIDSSGKTTGKTVTFLNGQTTVKLAHNETIILENLPPDATITVAETIGNYATDWKVDGHTREATDNTISIILADSTTVNVTNTLPYVAPTGVKSRHTPYVLLMIFGILILTLGGFGIVRAWKCRVTDMPGESMALSHDSWIGDKKPLGSEVPQAETPCSGKNTWSESFRKRGDSE